MPAHVFLHVVHVDGNPRLSVLELNGCERPLEEPLDVGLLHRGQEELEVGGANGLRSEGVEILDQKIANLV